MPKIFKYKRADIVSFIFLLLLLSNFYVSAEEIKLKHVDHIPFKGEGITNNFNVILVKLNGSFCA